MADTTSEPDDIIASIRTQLEGLKRTKDGMLLYGLIERGLGQQPGDSGGTDEAFLTFLYTLLERYANNRDGDPITRIKVRVIQQRITPHLLREKQNEEATVGEVPPPEPDAVNEVKPAEPGLPLDMETPEPPEKTVPHREEKAVGSEPPARDPLESELDSLELMPELAAELERGPEAEPASAPEPIKAKASPEAPKETPAAEKKKQPLSAPKSGEMKGDVEPVKPVKASELLNEPVQPSQKKPAAKENDKKSREAIPNKPGKAKQKSMPKKADIRSATATTKSEPPKKPVTLELVDATDLTKPPIKKQVKEEEAYIDLDVAETPVADKAGVPGKVPGAPKQELMPRQEATERAKPADTASPEGEPSQERVEKLHESFVHKMTESITRSQEYHRMLRSQMKAIKTAENENDFRDLKNLILMGMKELLKGNEALGRDLDSTSHYLKIARLDRALLKDELGRIKDNTTIDELTALQNKDAFIRQLESEISRVNRYGFSFAIAILDIDDLNAINTKFGRAAGDEVIRCYARQILSEFRSYDLVARNKDDEFLLLFPNTQKEGAMRAVEKAQKRAANLFITHKDRNIKVPTFTSVLTTYAPGDKPETLLKRTTDALVHAQKRGRDQVILALPNA